MKKIIFLLIMAVALASFALAVETAHPPWGVSLEAALSEYGADGHAVIPDTVLATQGVFELPAGFLASTDKIDNFIGKPQGYHIIKPIGIVEGRVMACNEPPDYQLRL